MVAAGRKRVAFRSQNVVIPVHVGCQHVSADWCTRSVATDTCLPCGSTKASGQCRWPFYGAVQ